MQVPSIDHLTQTIFIHSGKQNHIMEKSRTIPVLVSGSIISFGTGPGTAPRGIPVFFDSLICFFSGSEGSTILVGWLYRLE